MNSKYRSELVDLLSSLKDKKLMNDFLLDLFTPSEFEEITIRWQIIKLLSKGIPQRKIAKDLGVSIAKITRGSRELLDKKGGFWTVIKQRNKHL